VEIQGGAVAISALEFLGNATAGIPPLVGLGLLATALVGYPETAGLDGLPAMLQHASVKGRPVLLLHGTADSDVPVRASLHGFSFAAEPKRLGLVHDGQHDLCQSPAMAAELAGLVADWASWALQLAGVVEGGAGLEQLGGAGVAGLRVFDCDEQLQEEVAAGQQSRAQKKRHEHKLRTKQELLARMEADEAEPAPGASLPLRDNPNLNALKDTYDYICH
jgi:hypothetical protein